MSWFSQFSLLLFLSTFLKTNLTNATKNQQFISRHPEHQNCFFIEAYGGSKSTILSYFSTILELPFFYVVIPVSALIEKSNHDWTCSAFIHSSQVFCCIWSFRVFKLAKLATLEILQSSHSVAFQIKYASISF